MDAALADHAVSDPVQLLLEFALCFGGHDDTRYLSHWITKYQKVTAIATIVARIASFVMELVVDSFGIRGGSSGFMGVVLSLFLLLVLRNTLSKRVLRGYQYITNTESVESHRQYPIGVDGPVKALRRCDQSVP